jgi:carbon-monoxide dehydrogenase medium subunit
MSLSNERITKMKFDYMEASSIEEVVSILTEYDGIAKVLAGGTDLLLQIRNKLIKPKYLVDIEKVPRLKYIKYDGSKNFLIGALTSIRDLEKSTELKNKCSIIPQAASQLGSVAIRNMATIGGNLCNAAPSAETSPALIGLGAKIKIIGPEGERIIPLEDFFVGPGKTALKVGEVLVEIQVPVLKPNTKGIYYKHAIRGSIDSSIVGVAAILTMERNVCRDAMVVLGAVASTAIRAKRAEKFLIGQKINEALVDEAAKTAAREAKPITDVRATAEYRREMVKVFVKRAVLEALRI